jgi:hypothetical protein
MPWSRGWHTSYAWWGSRFQIQAARPGYKATLTETYRDFLYPLRKCRIVPRIRILLARFTGPLNSLFTSHPHSMSIITAIQCTIKLTTDKTNTNRSSICEIVLTFNVCRDDSSILYDAHMRAHHPLNCTLGLIVSIKMHEWRRSAIKITIKVNIF